MSPETQSILMLQGLVLATSLVCAVYVASVPRQDTTSDRMALRYFLGHFALMCAAVATYYVQFLPIGDYFLVVAYLGNGTLAILATYCLWYGVRWKQGRPPRRAHDIVFACHALGTTHLVFYLEVEQGVPMPLLRAGFYANLALILLATWLLLRGEAHQGMRMLRRSLLLIVALQIVTAAVNLIDPENLLYQQHQLVLLQVVSLICVLGGVYALYLYDAVERHHRESITDPLTGLYNRRYLDERLQAETARAQRTGEPLSLIACDIDHFKRINDTHGHGVGDQALIAIANTLQSTARTTDIVARAGGEEFLVVAPGTDLQNASALAERLRQHVAESHPLVGEVSLDLTASFGVAELSADHDALMAEADAALYKAKEQGRNRVVTGREPPPAFVAPRQTTNA